MVCGIHKDVSGDISHRTWLHETPKGCGAGVCPMDRLFKRYAPCSGSYENGGQRNYPVSYRTYASVFVLHSRIPDAFVDNVRLSCRKMEFVKNSLLCIIPYNRNSAGMLCKSGDYENVYTDIIEDYFSSP